MLLPVSAKTPLITKGQGPWLFVAMGGVLEGVLNGRHPQVHRCKKVGYRDRNLAGAVLESGAEGSFSADLQGAVPDLCPSSAFSRLSFNLRGLSKSSGHLTP